MPISKSESGIRGAAARSLTLARRNAGVLGALNGERAVTIALLRRELAAAETWKLAMAQRIMTLEQAVERLRRREPS